MDAVSVVVGIIGGLIAGLGGPGGLPVVSFLYSQTGLSTAEIAGTSSSIFFFATVFASLMYYYSGDINRKLILPLILPTLLGTTIGARINPGISREIFGLVTAVLITTIGLSVVYREIKELEPFLEIDYTEWRGVALISAVSLLIGVTGGIFGIGGPALSIPILIFLGVPALESIGAGLVQGVVVTSSTAVNYAFSGDVNLKTVLIIGLPYILTQIAGWYIAQNIDARKLKVVLGGLLALLGPYLLTTV